MKFSFNTKDQVGDMSRTWAKGVVDGRWFLFSAASSVEHAKLIQTLSSSALFVSCSSLFVSFRARSIVVCSVGLELVGPAPRVLVTVRGTKRKSP